jgi:hypothetical protein
MRIIQTANQSIEYILIGGKQYEESPCYHPTLALLRGLLFSFLRINYPIWFVTVQTSNLGRSGLPQSVIILVYQSCQLCLPELLIFFNSIISALESAP